MPWRNDELARLFQEMAELLELKGETGFRVRAYDRGARALSGYGADLATLSERELAAIPGVGKAIAAKVREYLDTGEVAGSLRRMKAAVHDVDLLAASGDPAAVARAFTGLPGVAEVVAAGDTKVS